MVLIYHSHTSILMPENVKNACILYIPITESNQRIKVQIQNMNTKIQLVNIPFYPIKKHKIANYCEIIKKYSQINIHYFHSIW